MASCLVMDSTLLSQVLWLKDSRRFPGPIYAIEVAVVQFAHVKL